MGKPETGDVQKSAKTGLSIGAWYVLSFGSILLNKYLLDSQNVQPNTLACVQLTTTALCGAFTEVDFRKLLTAGMKKKYGSDGGNVPLPISANSLTNHWVAQILLLGAMRFSTVLLTLVSLKFVAASFTETIKASAPFFTILFSFLLLGEKTRFTVVLSLIPVACGLVIATYHEISFNFIGFAAAVATVLIECVQNVFSKRLLENGFSATQLQFCTSVTAGILQAPIFIILAFVARRAEPVHTSESNRRVARLLMVAGLIYHLQSVAAYVVMSYISAISAAVVNTLKRALTIWITIRFFGNQVSRGTVFGTLICLGGTFLFHYTKQQPDNRK